MKHETNLRKLSLFFHSCWEEAFPPLRRSFTETIEQIQPKWKEYLKNRAEYSKQACLHQIFLAAPDNLYWPGINIRHLLPAPRIAIELCLESIMHFLLLLLARPRAPTLLTSVDCHSSIDTFSIPLCVFSCFPMPAALSSLFSVYISLLCLHFSSTLIAPQEICFFILSVWQFALSSGVTLPSFSAQSWARHGEVMKKKSLRADLAASYSPSAWKVVECQMCLTFVTLVFASAGLPPGPARKSCSTGLRTSSSSTRGGDRRATICFVKLLHTGSRMKGLLPKQPLLQPPVHQHWKSVLSPWKKTTEKPSLSLVQISRARGLAGEGSERPVHPWHVCGRPLK